jgi:REP element-mobilizing transposase RayT
MSQPPEPRRTGPPRNPGVRELVAGKRRWSSPPNKEDALLGFRGWHERGYLPHRDEPGLTQFVTFRLADAFPAALRSEWEALLQMEEERERRKELEAYLDKGRGDCHLRRPDLAQLAEDTLRFFHGRRYDLRAWVVMPNHVHVLFKVDTTPMSHIVGSWKKRIGRQANQVLGRQGEFWAEDYWDTYMRDSAHEQRARRYIENNPAKAFLVRDPKEWPWSSARFRDEYGNLRL